jgi:hypothetical protein
MSNDIYLMVNGTKIDVPEEMIKKINEVKTNLRDELINKFYTLAHRKYTAFEKKWIEIIHRAGVNTAGECGYFMVIKYPNCNVEWSYAMFSACKEFCGINNFSPENYPTHYKFQEADHMYIKLTTFKE